VHQALNDCVLNKCESYITWFSAVKPESWVRCCSGGTEVASTTWCCCHTKEQLTCSPER